MYRYTELAYWVVWSQDKLSKEEKATKVNLLRLKDQWRAIMRRSE